jgi:hypothetical protein
VEMKYSILCKVEMRLRPVPRNSDPGLRKVDQAVYRSCMLSILQIGLCDLGMIDDPSRFEGEGWSQEF